MENVETSIFEFGDGSMVIMIIKLKSVIAKPNGVLKIFDIN